MSAKTKVWKNGTQRIGIANDAKPIETPRGVLRIGFTLNCTMFAFSVFISKWP